MKSYTVTITPDDGDGAQTVVTLEVNGAAPRITELWLRAGANGSLSTGQLPDINLEQLLAAVTPGARIPAVTDSIGADSIGTGLDASGPAVAARAAATVSEPVPAGTVIVVPPAATVDASVPAPVPSPANEIAPGATAPRKAAARPARKTAPGPARTASARKPAARKPASRKANVTPGQTAAAKASPGTGTSKTTAATSPAGKGVAKASPDKPTPGKAGPRKAKPASTSPSDGPVKERIYRTVPDDFVNTFGKTTMADLAEIYHVPLHTIQGWARTARKQGKIPPGRRAKTSA